MTILLALIPAVLIGVGIVLIGAIGGNLRQQVLGVAIGAWIAGVASWVITRPEADLRALLICFFAGFLIVIGNRMLFHSYKLSGVAYSMAVTTGQQLVAVSLLGVVIFGEWASLASKLFGGSALVLLAIGTALAVYTEKTPTPIEGASPLRRLAVVTAASAAYAIYPIIIQASGIAPEAVGAPVMSGLLVGSFLLTSRAPTPVGADMSGQEWIDGGSRWGLRTLKLAGAGLAWGSGCIGLLWAMNWIGVATAFPLSQLNVIISVLGGILVLGETKTRKELAALGGGLVFLIAGAILIGLAKGADVVG